MLSDKPIGRPTKYRPEFCQQIIEFFTLDPYTLFLDEKGNPTGLPPKFPTFERFAYSIGIVKQTLYDWSKKHAEFMDAIKKAKELQKTFLIESSMAGIYDTAFSIFAAKNLMNWSNHGNPETPKLSGCKTPHAKYKRLEKALENDQINIEQKGLLTDQIQSEIAIIEATDVLNRLEKIEKSIDEGGNLKTSKTV